MFVSNIIILRFDKTFHHQTSPTISVFLLLLTQPWGHSHLVLFPPLECRLGLGTCFYQIEWGMGERCKASSRRIIKKKTLDSPGCLPLSNQQSCPELPSRQAHVERNWRLQPPVTRDRGCLWRVSEHRSRPCPSRASRRQQPQPISWPPPREGQRSASKPSLESWPTETMRWCFLTSHFGIIYYAAIDKT